MGKEIMRLLWIFEGNCWWFWDHGTFAKVSAGAKKLRSLGRVCKATSSLTERL